MKVIAKCHNYSGCVLAYRGENIELDTGSPLICPECGKTVIMGKGYPWVKTTLILSACVLMLGVGGAIYALKVKGTGSPANRTAQVAEATPEPIPGEGSTDTPRELTKPAEPPPSVVVPAKVELDVNRQENKTVKAEVLTRIDLMPGVTAANKDKLYLSVQRARSMGKVATIPFTSGQRTMSANDVQMLKDALETPEVLRLRDNPTCVFVILGFADTKGDDKSNRAVSQARADHVLSVMKSKANITANVMHAVAMGSSKLLDAENLEKNRIVEVWAVLP